MRTTLKTLWLSALLIPGIASAAQSTEELAKAAQNPIANMISLPFQNNTNLNIGPNDATQNILNVQPVYPFSLNDDWNVITRTIVPITSNPDVLTGDGRINGIGDTTFTAFFSPKNSEITWGVGPVLVMPTASDDALGSDKWSAGLSAVALAMPGKWVVGGVISNVWSFAGSGNNKINFFTLQPFINYNFDGGWYVTTAPIITANWEADSDHKWTVPLGGGFGKVFKIGNQPINAQLSLYNNVVTPDDFGAQWQVRAQLQFLFPK
jgi:hypothetical protein